MAFRVGFDDVVIDTAGNALSNVEVSVYKVGTVELQTIYNQRSGGTTKTNPFTTESNGRVTFFIESPQFDILIHDLNVPARFTDRTVTMDRVPGGGTAAQVMVANSSGLFVPVTMSGDATISNTGVLSVGNEKIEGKHVKASTLEGKHLKEGTIEGKHVKEETIENSDLAKAAKPLKWYAPSIIATEQERSNVAFGKMPTADEVKEISVPANGLLMVGFRFQGKQTVNGAGKITLFLNSEQMRTNNEPSVLAESAMNVGPEGTSWSKYFSSTGSVQGISGGQNEEGNLFNTSPAFGTFLIFSPEEGTYSVSLQFKASSGAVKVKNRRLWAAVLAPLP